jgi:hypothetical protein
MPWSPPPGVEGELILRVNVRDLPRGPGDKSGARMHEVPSSGMWRDFTKWAWNENWVAIESARSLVPSGGGVEQVNPALVKRICREVMIDNVRGQTPEWREDEVREASISMRPLGEGRIEYAGKVKMEAGSRSYGAKLYGQGEWDAAKGVFSNLDIVVIGMRSGKTQFNQRENDPGPAPMGVTLSLHRR